MTQERIQHLHTFGDQWTRECCSEIERLHTELTRLKTPHTCGECVHYHVELGLGSVCTFDCIGPKMIAPHTPWLCGHFQPKKGTK